MSNHRSFLLAATALAAMPTIALAQAQSQGTQQPAPDGAPRRPPAGGQAVEGVVVTGEAPIRSGIDRRSYSVTQDLQATSGSISDALRNVPSVQVDAQGNVSLRGDSNVQIMIDGKPSSMFEGEGRAQALEQLPADQIERVEVLTNPSASVRADGAAGIINLVTKKARRQQGYSGSVRANVGDGGRYNGGVSGSYRNGKVTMSGDLSVRHMGQKLILDDERARLDPNTGAMIESRETGGNFGDMDMVMGRAAIDYDLDDETRLSGEIRAMAFDFGVDNLTRLERDNAAGAVALITDRIGRIEQDRQNVQVTGTYRRRFEGDDHELVASQTLERTNHGLDIAADIVPVLPAAPSRFEGVDNDQIQRMYRTKVDYTRPVGEKDQLKTGFEVQVDDNDYDSLGLRAEGGAAPFVDPTRSFEYRFDQVISSGYLTYQHPVGDLTVLGGLRLEQVNQDLQLRGDAKIENDYFRAYPSLHVSYKLDDDQQVKLSYSRRIQRPSAEELNPFVIYIDEFNRRSGNPNLKPQVTDAFEAEYQYRRGGAFYLATAYYRERTKETTEVTRDLGGGVFLLTRENIGHGRAAGVELVANGRLTQAITYNLSGNLYWNEIDGSNLGFPGKRSDWARSFRGNVNWQVTPDDFIQVSGFLNGRRLTPQGYTEGHEILNLGYRHKFTDRFSFVFTAQDVLGTMKMVQVVDTPTLKIRTRRDFTSARGFHVGFTYAFGGAPQRQRDQGFDFGGGGPPPT